MNRKRHLDSIVGEEELEELDDELEDDEDWEDIEEEIKIKFGFLNAVKFGIGVGLGLFILGIILSFVGLVAFGENMGEIINTIK